MMEHSLVYLDNNATTPVLPEVLEAMAPYFADRFGNPSSIHGCGRRTLAAVKSARESVARLLGCRSAEILFTSGGTESDNIAILGMTAAGGHLITSAIEHSAIKAACAWMQKRGCDVTTLPVDPNGQVNPGDVRRALRKNTRMISVMTANNETGVLQAVEAIGKIAAEAGVWFHTDAVQAGAKVPVSVERIGCALLSISGHKMHAPQGIGALYVRRGTPLEPLFHGGHQQKGLRPGTENVPGIVGLGRACEIALSGLSDDASKRMSELRNRLESALTSIIPETGINGGAAARVPNTTNIYFDHIAGDALVLALDERNIAVSRGAACTSGERDPSSVLMAMGLSGERSRSSIRFSLGKQTTAADIEYVISAVPQAVRRLRATSPFYLRQQGLAMKSKV